MDGTPAVWSEGFVFKYWDQEQLWNMNRVGIQKVRLSLQDSLEPE